MAWTWYFCIGDRDSSTAWIFVSLRLRIGYLGLSRTTHEGCTKWKLWFYFHPGKCGDIMYVGLINGVSRGEKSTWPSKIDMNLFKFGCYGTFGRSNKTAFSGRRKGRGIGLPFIQFKITKPVRRGDVIIKNARFRIVLNVRV